MDLFNGFEEYLRSTDRGSFAGAYVSDVSKFAFGSTAATGFSEPATITPLDLVDYRSYLQRTGKAEEGRAAPTASPATAGRLRRMLPSICPMSELLPSLGAPRARYVAHRLDLLGSPTGRKKPRVSSHRIASPVCRSALAHHVAVKRQE